MKEVIIAGAARTPVGDFLGALKTLSPIELGTIAARKAIEKSGIYPEAITEVVAGVVFKAGFKGNPARQIQIGLGLPVEGTAFTVDQQCASGMKAFDLICQSIMLGQADAGLAVGTESMSRAAYALPDAREGYRLGDGHAPVDLILSDGLVCAMMGYHMGITAENLAEEYHITREEQDELAFISHTRAVNARKAGKFTEEIVPIEIKTRKGAILVTDDEHPREDISMEGLARLKPTFKQDGGTVTAGNASGINDAAAAMVLTAADKAAALGVKPLARVLATTSAGVEPRIMGIGPAYAVPKAIALAGLEAKDIAYYEINEAFAAQFLACNRVLKIPMDRVNANGSGIGIGHPVGCTGLRIIIALISELKRRNERYGVASLCVGGGPAMATVIENI